MCLTYRAPQKNDNCTDKCDETNYDKLKKDCQNAFNWFDKENGNESDISDDKTIDVNNLEKNEAKQLPQYYLESSCGDKKDWLTQHTLQSYFGGRQPKNYWVLSKPGTGLSVIENKNEIFTIGSLVILKRGKRKGKGTPAISQLVVVGMDIVYSEANSPGGHKYVLVLIDKCTTNSFLYGMHCTSGADIV